MKNPNTRATGTRLRCQPSFRRPLLVVGLLLGTALFSSLLSTDRSYTFTASEHPIDVMGNGAGRWFYYMPTPVAGGTARFAANVRRELLPQGYVEDTNSGPWHRFVKGGREVIVCNFDEIAFNGSFFDGAIAHEKPYLDPHTPYTVVWVRQTGADPIGVACFQVEKLVFRW